MRQPGCGIAVILALLCAALSGCGVDRARTSITEKHRQLCYPSESQKRWALAASALLTERNQERHDLLAGWELVEEYVVDCRRVLANAWGIRSRRDLFQVLEWLDQAGHRREYEGLSRYFSFVPKILEPIVVEGVWWNSRLRDKMRFVMLHDESLKEKSLLAWDYCRYISLCRWGYATGYIDEQTAWRLIMPAALLLQETYESWRDLGRNYISGRFFWNPRQSSDEMNLFGKAYGRLTLHRESPWKQIPWGMSLKCDAPNKEISASCLITCSLEESFPVYSPPGPKG